MVQKGPHGVLRPITWSTLIVGYSTYSHRVRAHARARECALPSCSDASEVAVAFTAAPHRATTFAFSATRADIFVVRSENAAASSVFAAASFAFCAVSASILAAHLRRARQDSRRGVERCLPRGNFCAARTPDALPLAWLSAHAARCCAICAWSSAKPAGSASSEVGVSVAALRGRSSA